MPPDTGPILAFDTSAAHCAAALLSDTRLLARRVEPMSRGQAERLLPLCEELLAEADLALSDLAAIGVGVGPGNFTGLRIGVAAARGVAFGLGIPAIGITTFAALAAEHPGYVLVMLNAQRESVFSQCFEDGVPLGDPAMHLSDTLPAVPEGTLCVGFNAARIAARLGCTAGPETTAPDPDVLARITAARAAHQYPPPAPLYLRPADAAPAAQPPLALLDDA